MDKSLTVAGLKQAQAGGTGPVLLDVRRKADHDAEPGGIPGAVWRDPEQVEQWRGELEGDRRVVVYCARGGGVSQSVRDALAMQGLDAKYLEGGLAAWREDGG